MLEWRVAGRMLHAARRLIRALDASFLREVQPTDQIVISIRETMNEFDYIG